MCEEGNEVIVYVLKILMNVFYGRFGISLESMIVEICDNVCWKELIYFYEEFLYGVEFKENINFVIYCSYIGLIIEKWCFLRNVVV